MSILTLFVLFNILIDIHILFFWQRIKNMLLWICQGNLHKIKRNIQYRLLSVAIYLCLHLIQCWVRWFSYYIKTINSNNTNRKIRMINEKIKKSFLLILPPPLFENWQITQLLNVPEYNYIKQMYLSQYILI